MSDVGLRFLIGWEGDGPNTLRMYDDGGPGRGNCTIGIGHLVHYGPTGTDLAAEAPFVNGITPEQRVALLRSDVPRYEAVVDRLATRELNQNQYDAMVDFAFNTGGGYPRIWALVNAGQDPRPVLEVTAITAAGVTDPARAAQITEVLRRRRKAEADLYNTPVEDEPMNKAERAEYDQKIGNVLNYAMATNRLLEVLIPPLVTGTPAEAKARFIWTAAGIKWPL